MKIIIAEDEQRMRQGLVRQLEKLGDEYEVIVQASNGQMALDMIVKMKPDVVFMDIKMPFMDGLSVVRAIRSYGMETQVVMVSAYADFELAQQSITLDVAGYLLKPPTNEEIEKVLRKIQLKIEGKQKFMGGVPIKLKEKYPEVHPLIRKALCIIENSFASKISQRQLAEELGISQEYFSYLFAKNIGQSFSVFLREYRIEQAKLMYQSGQYSKKDIPYRVGFSDSKYFGKVFREVTGMSPSEYYARTDKY